VGSQVLWCFTADITWLSFFLHTNRICNANAIVNVYPKYLLIGSRQGFCTSVFCMFLCAYFFVVTFLFCLKALSAAKFIQLRWCMNRVWVWTIFKCMCPQNICLLYVCLCVFWKCAAALLYYCTDRRGEADTFFLKTCYFEQAKKVKDINVFILTQLCNIYWVLYL